MRRKDFVKAIGVGSIASAVGFSACSRRSETDANYKMDEYSKKYEWRMVTTWPPGFPILGEACELFAETVQRLTNGRLAIKVYGSGELIPGLEVFDAVSSGTIEVGCGAAYYWAGKFPASQFFATVPFGMNAQEVNTWLYAGGGLELWRELYADFKLVPFVAGNTGMQMGGWFNRKIESVSDISGLKMRIPGLGGKVLNNLGGTAVLISGSEIYTSLERGVIDATEWLGPYHDFLMGFHEISKYYYYPGWHEPGSVLEIFVNSDKFQQLPNDLKSAIEVTCSMVNQWVFARIESKNAEYLQKLKSLEDIELLAFPEDVQKAFNQETKTVIEDLVSSSKQANKIWTAYSKFRNNMRDWSAISGSLTTQ